MKYKKLVFENWKYPNVDVMPEDGDLCIVLWKSHDEKPNIFVGGYYSDRKEFWNNWGLGGAVLNEEDIVCWKLLDDYKFE